jgi:hypothetical protein
MVMASIRFHHISLPSATAQLELRTNAFDKCHADTGVRRDGGFSPQCTLPVRRVPRVNLVSRLTTTQLLSKTQRVSSGGRYTLGNTSRGR